MGILVPKLSAFINLVCYRHFIEKHLKMKCFTKTVVLKVLKLLIFAMLLICSLWFMKDAWIKFNAKATNFRIYSEIRYEVPTTVFCFSPKEKPSGLIKYNLTPNDFIYPSDGLIKNIGNLSWDQVEKEIFYHLNQDFELEVELRDKKREWLHPMKEGRNGENETFVHFTKIITFYNGICYKITFDYDTFMRRPRFHLLFNRTEDKPKVTLFLTSKENSHGIITKYWSNGEPLELELLHQENYFRYFQIKSSNTNPALPT